MITAACTGSSPAPSPRPTPSPKSTLARGVVAVRVVHTCGAGERLCPAALLRRLRNDVQQHGGVPFATPDTAIVQGFGCGGALRAPFGKATVSASTIRWRVDFVGAGPDCFGPVIGFVKFARPVYDMRSPVSFVAVETAVGKHPHIERYAGFAAPDLSRWVRHDAEWVDPEAGKRHW
jgi:hypothetical protein